MRFLSSLPRPGGALLLLIVAVALAGPARAQQGNVVDEIVAVVGDQIILRSDVDGYVVSAMRQQQMPYSEELWAQALRQLVDSKAMAVVAQRDTTIKVTDEQVEQALNQRLDQLRQQVGSEARIEELYGKSILQLKADMRDEFRTQLLGEQLQQRQLGKVRVGPSEVREWFEQFPTDSLPTLPEAVRVSHIVRYPELSQAARQEAFEVISTIRDSVVAKGASFEELARAFSDDPGSAPAGGRIEDTRLGDLVPEFAAIASRVPIGEVSQVFETPFGYHIVRVNERRGDVIDFNHVLIRIDDSQVNAEGAIEYLNVVRDSILAYAIPFEVMAKRHSEEEGTAALGGRVTDPRTGERDLFVNALGPQWQLTLDTLEVGEISEPAEVELLDGRRAYHIVLLQKRIPTHQWDFETDYQRIREYALQEKRARMMEEWLRGLREKVYIDLKGKAANLATADEIETGR